MPMTASVTTAPTTSATAPHGSSTSKGPTSVQALAAYPHISKCQPCLRYAETALDTFSVTAVLQATLAHHESNHRAGRLDLRAPAPARQ
jgi:hypothetical protein